MTVIATLLGAATVLALSLTIPQVSIVDSDSAGATTPEAAITAKLKGGIAILKTATVLVSAGHGPKDVSKGDFDGRVKALHNMLAAFYVGEPLDRFSMLLVNAVNDERDRTTRDIGGGSRKLEVTSITINGTTAFGTARSLDWLQDADRSTGKANPEMSGWWTYRWHATKTKEGWRIDQLSFDPEPGSEP